VLRDRIKEIAAARVRYGYRRISVLLRREGFAVNDKRVYRLYAAQGLSLRAKMPHRRRAVTPRSLRVIPVAINQVWSMDFMHDRLADSRAFRLLTIVDIYSRECVALEVAPRFCSDDVVDILKRACRERGVPSALRCDNGTELSPSPLISGPFGTRLRSIFHDPASRLITPSSNLSTAAFAENSSIRRTSKPSTRLARPRGFGAKSTMSFVRIQCWRIKRPKSLRLKRQIIQEADLPTVPPVYEPGEAQDSFSVKRKVSTRAGQDHHVSSQVQR